MNDLNPFAVWSAWAKLWALPIACADAGVRMIETMTLAPAVMQARMPALQVGLIAPWTADRRELQLMVTEKITAWSDAFAIAQRDFYKLGVRPSGSWTAAGLFDDWVRLMDVTLRMPGRSHRPIHRAVLANHRRLTRGSARISPG